LTVHEYQRQQYLIANAVYSNGPRNLSSRLTNPPYQHLHKQEDDGPYSPFVLHLTMKARWPFEIENEQMTFKRVITRSINIPLYIIAIIAWGKWP